jgi:hypothetical protein
MLQAGKKVGNTCVGGFLLKAFFWNDPSFDTKQPLNSSFSGLLPIVFACQP